MYTARGAACLLGVIALAFAIQVPAEAESYTQVDARHDVEKAPQNVRAAQYRKADVTRLRVTHGQTAIRFTIRLRSASLKHLRFRIVGFTVKTPDHSFTGDWIAERGTAQYDFYDETGNPVSCTESSGRTGRIVWLKLNRACVEKPRWIRVSVGVGTNNGTEAWGDNALSDNWQRTYDDVFSPRIHAAK